MRGFGCHQDYGPERKIWEETGRWDLPPRPPGYSGKEGAGCPGLLLTRCLNLAIAKTPQHQHYMILTYLKYHGKRKKFYNLKFNPLPLFPRS